MTDPVEQRYRDRGVRSKPIPMRFEVTALPVADVDRAKAFYETSAGGSTPTSPLDEHYRVVQFTPPGSPASIQFGAGLTAMAPGSAEGMLLIVDDIEAARDDLIGRGSTSARSGTARPGTEGHEPGLDPERRSYAASPRSPTPTATRWLLQEITTAAPGPGGDDGRRGARAAPAGDGRASRRVRGGRPAARLVGLVRGVHGRSPGREQPGGGLRGRRALHGGGEARCRPARLTPPAARSRSSTARRSGSTPSR